MARGVVFCLSFIYSYILIAVTGNDKCESCILMQNCPTIEALTKKEQQKWLLELQCKGPLSRDDSSSIEVSSATPRDYICCPNKNIWENYNRSENDIKETATESNDLTDFNDLNAYINNKYEDENALDKIPETTPIRYKKFRKRQAVLPINQNPYFLKKPTPQQSPTSNINNGFDADNSYPETSLNMQCVIQTSPPDPATGCCGRDTSDNDRIKDLQGVLNTYAPSYPQQIGNFYPQPANRNQAYYLPRLRPAGRNNGLEVKLEGKLAGGKKTELDQFPWTALLLLTFDDGNNVASFQCGGSLISGRYIITAAHCVYEAGARLSEVQITLAEYDKRTFPEDCVGVGEGKTCIQNVLIQAEKVIIHPQFDDIRLRNDIAMIRLRGFAPYTRYIRPICIAPLNIDSESFSNLPLVASGWGRNKQYLSNVKQSTVVNLVPHEECLRFYPNLSSNQLCAAGRTGEDTCKGDSGGPLMILYRGSYYLIGVVSGKRVDSPCGTSVPSLYTNVFNYIPWIKSVINSQ